MPEFRTVLEILSALLVPVAAISYALSVMRGLILPTKATWVVWTILSVLLTWSMYRAGTLNLQIVSATPADLIVLALALLYGEKWEWSVFDVTCLVLSGISIILWQYTGDPVWGVTFNSLAITISSFPLFKEVWFKPEIEKPLPWIVMSLSSVCELGALRHWSTESAMQPLVYLVVPGIVVVLTLFPVRPQTAKLW